jgi:hypothetical protein
VHFINRESLWWLPIGVHDIERRGAAVDEALRFSSQRFNSVEEFDQMDEDDKRLILVSSF